MIGQYWIDERFLPVEGFRCAATRQIVSVQFGLKQLQGKALRLFVAGAGARAAGSFDSAALPARIDRYRRYYPSPGQLDARVANAVGYLTSVLLRALEQGPMEERLAKLEATLGLATNPQPAPTRDTIKQ